MVEQPSRHDSHFLDYLVYYCMFYLQPVLRPGFTEKLYGTSQ